MYNPFRYFNSSPEVIRLAVMTYIRYSLSLRQVGDFLFERGIDICHETRRYWWNRFGPLFASEIRKRRTDRRNWSNWRWHLDEVFVRINGETHYLWRIVEITEGIVHRRRPRNLTSKLKPIYSDNAPVSLTMPSRRAGQPSHWITRRSRRPP